MWRELKTELTAGDIHWTGLHSSVKQWIVCLEHWAIVSFQWFGFRPNVDQSLADVLVVVQYLGVAPVHRVVAAPSVYTRVSHLGLWLSIGHPIQYRRLWSGAGSVVASDKETKYLRQALISNGYSMDVIRHHSRPSCTRSDDQQEARGSWFRHSHMYVVSQKLWDTSDPTGHEGLLQAKHDTTVHASETKGPHPQQRQPVSCTRYVPYASYPGPTGRRLDQWLHENQRCSQVRWLC